MSSKVFIIPLIALITLFIGIYFIKYHKFPIETIVFKDKRALEQELSDIRSSRYNYRCSWRYGYDKEYHVFMLICFPWEKGNTTYQVAEKKYKIKRNLLKIDDTYMHYGERKLDSTKNLNAWNGPPVNLLNIHWNE